MKEPTKIIFFEVTSSATGQSSFVQLKIYDILGREITTLVNEEQSPGNYEITFDAGKLTSGVYYYRLKTGDFIDVKKMILIK